MSKTIELAKPVRIMTGKHPVTPGMTRTVKEVIHVLSQSKLVKDLAAVDNFRIIGPRPRY